MTRDELLRRLRSHRAEIASLGAKSLAVFGSAARGQAGPESDVDLLVEFEGRATFDRYMALKDYLEELLGCRVDLVTRNALKARLRPRVEEEAVYVA